VKKIEGAAAYFNRFCICADSFWYKKSNAFTIFLTLCDCSDHLERVNLHVLKTALVAFGEEPPHDYTLAAKEGVNKKKGRTTRAGYVRRIVAEPGGAPTK